MACARILGDDQQRASCEAILSPLSTARSSIEQSSGAGTASRKCFMRPMPLPPPHARASNRHSRRSRPAVPCNRVSTTRRCPSALALTSHARRRRNLSIARRARPFSRRLAKVSTKARRLPTHRSRAYFVEMTAPSAHDSARRFGVAPCCTSSLRLGTTALRFAFLLVSLRHGQPD